MTAISKNVYFDVLDDIVNKYNYTVLRTIKMKPMLKIIHILIQWNWIQRKKLMIKILNLKLMIVSKFLSTKIVFQEDTHQTDLKTFLLLRKLKTQSHGHI